MSGRAHTLANKLRPRLEAVVEIARATCSLCRERADCAVIALDDVADCRLCFSCSVTLAQFIAHAQRTSARPHKRPCYCETCTTFDGGQRGEIANVALLDEEHAVLSRWQLLEVDP